MGMGFQTISDYNAPPLFQSLVDAKAVKEPVFAFKLSTDEGAELTLGGLNSALYKGDITYVPVKEKGYWQIQMDSVNVGDKKPVSSIGAIVDSGMTLIVGDSKKRQGVL
jgi:cathepsin D